MGAIGVKRYVDLRIVDINNSPVTGLSLSNFSIVFRRNNATCSDALSMLELGSGEYSVTYVPGATGHDYLELYNSSNDLRTIDIEEILANNEDTIAVSLQSSTVTLTETYKSISYTVTAATPSGYIVYAFLASDWLTGVRDTTRSLGYTSVTSAGHWVSPLYLAPGVYTLAAIALSGQAVQVLAPDLVLP